MKNNYPIQVIDVRIQVDHIIPKQIRLHQENRVTTNSAWLLLIIIRYRDIELISDGTKFTEVTVIWDKKTKKLNLNDKKI